MRIYTCIKRRRYTCINRRGAGPPLVYGGRPRSGAATGRRRPSRGVRVINSCVADTLTASARRPAADGRVGAPGGAPRGSAGEASGRLKPQAAASLRAFPQAAASLRASARSLVAASLRQCHFRVRNRNQCGQKPSSTCIASWVRTLTASSQPRCGAASIPTAPSTDSRRLLRPGITSGHARVTKPP